MIFIINLQYLTPQSFLIHLIIWFKLETIKKPFKKLTFLNLSDYKVSSFYYSFITTNPLSLV